jgi:dihydroorotate dehydrogenase (NAD+) catalytic subunit
VDLSELGLRGPVVVAAGCGGTGRELAAFGDLEALGGFVTRSVSVHPRQAPAGHARPVQETPSGLAHALGCPNPGVDAFLALELPALLRSGAAVHVSLVGRTLGEYAELARRVGRTPGVAGLEVNLAEPDAVGAGLFDVREPFHAASVVAAVRRDAPHGLPVLAKVRADVVRVVESARTVLEAGASGVVVGGAQPASLSDGRPAGLSGPAVRPLALRCVAEVCRAVPDAAVVGAGGIVDADDARAFLDAGATAVQVGAALLHDPTVAHRLAAELAVEPGDPADHPQGETVR